MMERGWEEDIRFRQDNIDCCAVENRRRCDADLSHAELAAHGMIWNMLAQAQQHLLHMMSHLGQMENRTHRLGS